MLRSFGSFITTTRNSEYFISLYYLYLALRTPGLAPHQLRERLHQGPAAAKEEAVVAVGRDDAVLLGDRRLHADRNRLLPVVEVAEPADQLRLVERVGRDLHAPHRRHVAEEGHELPGRGLDGARRGVASVAGEGDAGLDSEGGGVGGGGEGAAERLGEREGGGGQRF